MAANFDGGSGVSGAGSTPRADDSGLNDQYEDLVQLARARVTAAASGLFETLRANPSVAAGIVAVGIGAVVGIGLGRRRRKGAGAAIAEAVEDRAEAVAKGAKRAAGGARKAGRAMDYGELLPLAMKLFENPVVRGFVVQAAMKNLAKRFK